MHFIFGREELRHKAALVAQSATNAACPRAAYTGIIQRMDTEWKRPGDTILKSWMPNASEAEREAARENLRALASFILRRATRRATDRYQAQIRVMRDQGLL